ncbi:MAG: ABC transporter permease [Anaerolineae bacterium]
MTEATTTITSQATARELPEQPRIPFSRVIKQHWMLYLMLLPALVLLALFHYYPLWGVGIAFVDYSPAKGLADSPWVGLGNFQRFFGSRNAVNILRNTVVIAVGKIVFGQIMAIIFALALNEIRHELFKRSVQTITTLPNFLSWVIIGGIMVTFLSTSGPINNLVKTLGGKPIRFLGDASVFPWTLILSNVWKGFGFGAIIYLAALMAINPELYEAATVDGANRWQRLLNITIPGISSTIALMACLNLGSILNAGFEQVLVLYNPVVYKTGDIIDTYVYRVGLVQTDYSLGTAVGLFKSVIGFFLIMLSYWLADRFANYRIF